MLVNIGKFWSTFKSLMLSFIYYRNKLDFIFFNIKRCQTLTAKKLKFVFSTCGLFVVSCSFFLGLFPHLLFLLLAQEIPPQLCKAKNLSQKSFKNMQWSLVVPGLTGGVGHKPAILSLAKTKCKTSGEIPSAV